MTSLGLLQIAVYFVVLLLLVKPLGLYMARVFTGQSVGIDRLFGPLERGLYRLAGVRANEEMGWRGYALAVLLFNGAGVLGLYLLQRIQGLLPLNPQAMVGVDPALAFNTAASFVTNTNWQNYAGETTMSYLTQMLGMTVQNFLSAATGLAILVALIRGLARRQTTTIGNFWVDMVRGTLYILLPFSLVLALVLVSQGVVQTFSAYHTVQLVQPTTDGTGKQVTEQVLAVGPVASQAAIKHLGTNGGGFYNANAAHPFESPTPFTDTLLILCETVLAAALTYTFGKMVGDTRQGWLLLAVMLAIFIPLVIGCYAAEAQGNPVLTALGVDQQPSLTNPGGNMEGKELRFGVARSSLFAIGTTATSTGAVDAMHDSFTPLGGLAQLIMMMFGEVVLGGVGTGMYGMLIFAIIAVFVAGLMVGRTPEYLGKKIDVYEMKMASIAILIMPAVVLSSTAIAVVLDAGTSAALNGGPHGFSEILYAFTSMGNNNGSAFAGLSGNTPFYNVAGALVMLLGRFWPVIPTLAIAGSLARKKLVPTGAGTLPTHTPLFGALLGGVVVIVGALTFIPSLALGPIVEHLLLFR
ncbi:MAG: potassium-transporting ATPase subunit KdpA [Herpetosiphon sp.]